MGADSVRSLCDHDVAELEIRRRNMFDVEDLAVLDHGQHAPASRLKTHPMPALKQSSAQVLE
jgi:hypothetical protein